MAIKLKVQEGGAVKFTVGSADGVKFMAESGIPIYPNYYTDIYEVTPTESEQSLATSGLMMSDDVSVHAVPSDYVGSAIDRRSSTDITASGATVSVPSGYYEENASKSVQSGSVATPTGGITATPTISVDSSGLITASVSKSESISPIVNEGYVTSGTAGTITFSGSATSQLSTQAGKTVTPTESVQTAVGAEKFTTGAVKVGAIPSDYVGSGITQRSSADLSASGDTVTAPSGYYAESASKSVASGSATTPATSITADPTISVDSSTGLISASVSASKSVTPTVSAGYVSSGTSGAVSVSGSNTEQLSTQAGTTITPTTSEQTAVSAGKYTLGDVKVSAMPTGAKNAQVNTWGWTSTTKKLTVTFPNATSGYYTGTQAGAVTPIELYRQTETVTPTESSQEVTPTNGTYYIEKVTVDAIPSNYVGSGITQRDSTDLTASGATVTAPAGYYGSAATKTIASGSATPAASISATGAGKTVGNGTITLTKSAVSNTPQVTAGYISSGTAGNTSVSLTASVTTQAGQTYHPSTTDQSVAANTYVLGAQTFNAVTTTNLTAENIKDGVTIKIGDSTDDDCVTSVTGSYTGGGANLQAKTNIDPTTSSQTITADTGYDGLSSVQINAMPSGTEGTPTATKGTVNNHAISVTPSVTNVAGYISGGTHNGTAVSVSASELVSGTVNITASGNTDVTNYATASVAAGGATASASKGTVSNHSITVTPSVTRTAGYITAGTASGTAVTVSASELVSGSETKTANGTYDVTNLAEIVVDVQGGGGGGVQIGKTTKTLSSAASSIQFTSLSGNPTSFVVTSAEDIATNTSGVTAVVFDGTSLHGQTMTTQVTADTGFTKSYSNGTLTITATTASFRAVEYKLVYTYGGSASDIETADVQVGSGATSITFPVTGRPAYWSCIFKSDFSTSSGYQRVIEVVNDGSSTYGLAMDSSAHAASSWTATYSGGNLTINSQGTNNGGYFHQPGYYQLTYYVDESAPQYQSKTVTPTTSQQTVTPDTGYDALSQVTVNAIPSEYIIPSGNLAITQNGNNINVAQYATVSVNVSGGGTLTVATKTLTHTSTGQTLSFTSLSGQPKYWFLRTTTNVSSSGSTTYYYVTDCFYDGTNIKGNTFRIGSTRRVQNITSGISQSYSNGTLTITAGNSSTATPGQFYGASNFGYELVYIY